jgi:hypothetical protein
MKPEIKVGILSHRSGNIGHGMMALGVECILKEALNGFDTRIVHIEQHRPFSIYSAATPFHLVETLPGRLQPYVKRLVNRRGVSRMMWNFCTSDVSEIDFAITCSGPAIQDNVSRSPFLGLVLHHLLGAFHSKNIPVFNFGIGSCYPFERLPATISNRQDEIFVRRMLEYSDVATVRDELAERLCLELGRTCRLVPCPALLTGKAFEEMSTLPKNNSYIVVNYQKEGANSAWGQAVDPGAWEGVIKEVLQRISRRHDVIFVCHSEEERELANKLDPAIRAYRPKTLQEYATLIAGATAGLCNRIHAGIALAGTGAPVVVVGTDSRLGTVKAIGLPCFYVNAVDSDLLEEVLEGLIQRRKSESERLLALREQTLSTYVEILRNGYGL